MAKTIVIVDDSASMRRVVGIALKGAGYDVIEGSDGNDALERRHGRKPPGQRPCIALQRVPADREVFLRGQLLGRGRRFHAGRLARRRVAL